MPVLQVQRDLNVAIAEFAELKEQLERDTLVLSVLKQLQEVREKGDVIPHPDPRPVFHLSFGSPSYIYFSFFPLQFDTSLKQCTALLPEKKYVPAACYLNKVISDS